MHAVGHTRAPRQSAFLCPCVCVCARVCVWPYSGVVFFTTLPTHILAPCASFNLAEQHGVGNTEKRARATAGRLSALPERACPVYRASTPLPGGTMRGSPSGCRRPPSRLPPIRYLQRSQPTGSHPGTSSLPPGASSLPAQHIPRHCRRAPGVCCVSTNRSESLAQRVALLAPIRVCPLRPRYVAGVRYQPYVPCMPSSRQARTSTCSYRRTADAAAEAAATKPTAPSSWRKEGGIFCESLFRRVKDPAPARPIPLRKSLAYACVDCNPARHPRVSRYL